MVNITDFTNTTKFKIESPIEPSGRPWGIPMGGVLTDCKRRLWYQFRWADIGYINAKTKRIFERGHLEEKRIVKDLERIGCTVIFDGDQQLRLTSHFGHARGRPDGLVYGTPEYPNEWVMLEMKTANQNRFNGFVKDGVKSNLAYLGQAHMYMGELQRNNGVQMKDYKGNIQDIDIIKEYGKIKTCLFIVTNKNDEERYYEFFDYDEAIDAECSRNIMETLHSDTAPSRIGMAQWWKCNHCQFRAVCHDDKLVPRSCRTCQHIEWHDKGIIKCGLIDEALSIDDQIEGCDEYKRIEID